MNLKINFIFGYRTEYLLESTTVTDRCCEQLESDQKIVVF